MSETVHIYTDGACKGNPGPGGWGAWLRWGAHEREMFGGATSTTNNRMELTAVIEALASLKRRCTVAIYTDSAYVRNGITGWIHQWKSRGWRTADHKPVKNLDLWRRLDELAAQHEIQWHWVRGMRLVGLANRRRAVRQSGSTAVVNKRREPAETA